MADLLTERKRQGAIDHETLTPGLSSLYAVADKVLATEGFKGCKVECGAQHARKGPPECCRERNWTQIEFDYIAAWLPPDQMEQVASKAIKGSKGYCPFLDTDDTCMVHPVRPLDCRMIGVIEPAPSTCHDIAKVTAAKYEDRVWIREHLVRLLAVIAGPGMRRRFSEWLVLWDQERAAPARFERSMPGRGN